MKRRADSSKLRLDALPPLVAAAAFAVAPAGAQEPPQRFEERVEVRRVVLETRVVDRHGEPVRGLAAADFHVTVADRPVRLESVEWVGAVNREEIADRLLAGEDVGHITPPPPKLIVLFYQTSVERSRAIGHVRMALTMDTLVDALGFEDKVAVVTFGSRLRVLLDFTADRDAIAEATTVTAVMSDAPPPRRFGFPSLARNLDWKAAEKAATPEAALLVTARALEPIAGPKTMLLIGWGLGRLTRSGVVLGNDYDAARQALARSHTSVFALDVTDADWHSLEVGLEKVAEDTGGTYAKTHLFPELALEQLGRALAGHYELVFELPELPTGVYDVEVEVDRRAATVLYQDAIEVTAPPIAEEARPPGD